MRRQTKTMKTAESTTIEITPNRKLISPRELAERWDVSKPTIYRWQRSGVLDPIRIGGSVRFALDQVEEIERKG